MKNNELSLVEEHLNSNNSPFRFNAKELDQETGNYYYGARYYDPKFSIWISVDPLAEEMPAFSSYAYAFNNPIRFTDPTGMKPEIGPDDPPKGSRNVVVISQYSKPVGADDNGDGIDDAQAINNLSAEGIDSNALIIFATSKKDMLAQLKEGLGDDKINNLIIKGHGGYKNPGIYIGDDYISSDGAELLGKDLRPFMIDGESSIVVASCHAGAGRNMKGETFAQKLANGSGADVYASRTWSKASTSIFDNGYFNFLGVNYANFGEMPFGQKKDNNPKPNSVSNLGLWTLARPNAESTSTVSNLYYRSNGNFRFK